MMPHKFTIKIGKDLHTYSNFEDIPDKIDHVISFLPEIPPEPHTDEQHAEIDKWPGRLKELQGRCDGGDN